MLIFGVIISHNDVLMIIMAGRFIMLISKITMRVIIIYVLCQLCAVFNMYLLILSIYKY